MTESTHIIASSAINFSVYLKWPHALLLTYHRNKQSCWDLIS
jgi:hypothetical protein